MSPGTRRRVRVIPAGARWRGDCVPALTRRTRDMTTRKHFKQLVRDRMRSTGEKYTVARRHVEGDSDVGAARRRPRRHRGVRQRARQPRRRARRRAAVGGDGAGRRRRARRRLHPLGVQARRLPRRSCSGFRRLWQYPDRWATETAARLGLHASSARDAAAPRARPRRWRSSSTAGCRRSSGSTTSSSA